MHSTKLQYLNNIRTEIVEAYTKNGQTLNDLAKFHNCGPNTIRQILLQEKVVMRTRGRRKKTATN